MYVNLGARYNRSKTVYERPQLDYLTPVFMVISFSISSKGSPLKNSLVRWAGADLPYHCLINSILTCSTYIVTHRPYGLHTLLGHRYL